MATTDAGLARLRTRWSAIGAAVAITLGAGGIGLAQAAVDSGEKPVTVTVDSKRILDTRTNVGLAGAFVKDTPRDVQVTGPVDVVTDTGTAKETVVPAGASAVLVNVTVVTPTDQGFLTLRAGGTAGPPKTSTVNFAAGSVEPNAATVDLSADGKVQVWVFMPSATAKADVLVDIVGYTIDHNHDDRYYTEPEVDAAIAAAVAPKANSSDVYAKSDVYTKAETDGKYLPTSQDSHGAIASIDSFPTLTALDKVILSATVDTPSSGYVMASATLNVRQSTGTPLLRCSLTTTPDFDLDLAALDEIMVVDVVDRDIVTLARGFVENKGERIRGDDDEMTVNVVCDSPGGATRGFAAWLSLTFIPDPDAFRLVR